MFSRFWIIFTIIILNSFSGRLSPILFDLMGFYHVPLSAEYFSAFSSCLDCCVLGWPFCMLDVCGSSLLWRFLPVGRVGCMACQGFLVREACVGVLVGGAGSPLSGVQ